MATKNVRFNTIPSEASSIEVDNPLVKAEVGDTIKFHNQLTGHPEVKIELFFVDNEISTPANGLCEGVSGNELTKSGAGNVDCKIEKDGNIKYDVSAAGHTKLDPVVIIDELNLNATDQPGQFGGLTLALVALAALIVGYLIGKRKQNA